MPHSAGARWPCTIESGWGVTRERCAHEGTVQGRPPLMLAVRTVLLVAALGLQHDAVAVEQAEHVLDLDAAGVRTEREVYEMLHDAGSTLLRNGVQDVGLRVLTLADRRLHHRDDPEDAETEEEPAVS